MSDSGKKPVQFSLSNTKDYKNAFLKVKFGNGMGKNDSIMVEGFGKLFAKRFGDGCVKTESDGMPGVLEIKACVDDKQNTDGLPTLSDVIDIVHKIEQNIKNNPKFSIYEIDANSASYVEGQVGRISKRVNASLIKGGLSIITSSVFKQFVENIKLQEIIDFANNVQVALPSADSAKSVKAINLLKCGMFSAANCLLAMFKWTNVLNRQGTPTYLLTENQWKNLYELGISPNAPQIDLICPNQMGGYDPIFAKKQSGMSKQDAKRFGNAMIRAFEKLAMPFNQQTEFHMQTYYDFSDTIELVPGAKNQFYNDYVVNNVTGELNDKAQTLVPNPDQKDIKMIDDAIKQANDSVNKQLMNNDRNVTLVWNAFKELAKEKPDIYGSLGRARSLVDGLREYYKNIDFIDREKDTTQKEMKIDFCIFETLVALKIDVSQIFDMIRKRGTELILPNNYLGVKSAVGSFVRDVERVNKAVVESKENKNVIKESFVNLWNKIVKQHQNNTQVYFN